MKMARTKTMKSIDEQIETCEETLRKLKERCDKISEELDGLYEQKRKIENQEILDAIEHSSRSRAEILAFLESHS